MKSGPNTESPRHPSVVAPHFAIGLPPALVILGLALSSCSSTSHLERADKAVYGIIDSARQLTDQGEGEEFSIDTPVSEIDPADLSSRDILKARRSGDSLKLGIDQALDLAVVNSRTFQNEKETLYLTALTLTGERHNFRPQFHANSTATHTWFPDGGSSGERRGTVRSNIGVGQMLLTGGDIGINIANDLLRFFTGGDPRKSAVSTISANLTQPLLRGAGRKIAAERLTQAHRDVIYAVRDFSHFQDTFSSEIVVQYFRLLQQKDTIHNQYANYKSRVATTAYLRARAVDRAKPLDVGSAEQDELAAKNAYIASVVSFKNAVDGFKITLGIPTSTRLILDDSEMKKLRSAGPLSLHLDPPQAFGIALANRLPLLNSIDRFEDSKRQVAVAADALKPGLNLFADASLPSGDGPLDYSRFNFHDITADVGLTLDLPVNKTVERNNYRATRIRFEAEARALGLSFDQLRNDVEQSIRRLAQFRQSYVINRNALELALKRVEGARLQLEAGTALFRDLQEAQDALIRAQNDVTAALVDYLEVRLGLLADLGILKTKDRFWLQADCARIDLPRPPAGILPDAFLEGEEILTPDQIFNQ
jgi:outer membrane protein TolC